MRSVALGALLLVAACGEGATSNTVQNTTAAQISPGELPSMAIDDRFLPILNAELKFGTGEISVDLIGDAGTSLRDLAAKLKARPEWRKAEAINIMFWRGEAQFMQLTATPAQLVEAASRGATPDELLSLGREVRFKSIPAERAASDWCGARHSAFCLQIP